MEEGVTDPGKGGGRIAPVPVPEKSSIEEGESIVILREPPLL